MEKRQKPPEGEFPGHCYRHFAPISSDLGGRWGAKIRRRPVFCMRRRPEPLTFRSDNHVTARKATLMKDTIADALQKIAAGGRAVGSAATPQTPEISAGPPMMAVAPEVLQPQPPALQPTLPSALQAFHDIVICPPEPAEIPMPNPVDSGAPEIQATAVGTPPTAAFAQDGAVKSPVTGRMSRFSVPDRLRSFGASTARTAVEMQNSASWSDRLRTAAAVLLSVGMAWVVWADLRVPATTVAVNEEDAVDVDQLLKEFETADQHSPGQERELQRIVSQPALKSEPQVLDLESELSAPQIATGQATQGKVQRTAATSEADAGAQEFSEPATIEPAESEAEAVYPDQQPARPTPKAGSGRPLRFTGQIQPMNRPAIAN